MFCFTFDTGDALDNKCCIRNTQHHEPIQQRCHEYANGPFLFCYAVKTSASVTRDHTLKPGVHTKDFAPIDVRRAKKLGHASLATVFRPGRLIFSANSPENLEWPVVRSQPITTTVITDTCLNTRWHHGAYISPKEDTMWLH